MKPLETSRGVTVGQMTAWPNIRRKCLTEHRGKLNAHAFYYYRYLGRSDQGLSTNGGDENYVHTCSPKALREKTTFKI